MKNRFVKSSTKENTVQIQEVIREVEEGIEALKNVESEAENKLSTIEEIRDRAVDASSTLESDLGVLQRIQENMEDIDTIVSDAEYENLV